MVVGIKYKKINQETVKRKKNICLFCFYFKILLLGGWGYSAKSLLNTNNAGGGGRIGSKMQTMIFLSLMAAILIEAKLRESARQ